MENKCIVCDKELEVEAFNDVFRDAIGIVYGATIWRSHGNYGSTVYDPMFSDEYLEVFVCDECLKQKRRLVRRTVCKREVTMVSSGPFEDTSVDEAQALAHKIARQDGKMIIRSHTGDASRIIIRDKHTLQIDESKLKEDQKSQPQ